MFRNKVLVQATPPSFAAASLFRLLPLFLSSPSARAEALCWKLSRRWRLACLYDPSQILVVFQESQSGAAARVVEELRQTLGADVKKIGEEEEVEGSSLVARAVECGLRCAMLENGWRCLGDNSFVHSSFGAREEKKHLCAVSVKVQSETDNDFILVVSPDVLRFSRHKISDLVGSKLLQNFNDGEEVILEECNFSTACTTLHSLTEGHVIGMSKQPLVMVEFERMKELWKFKHGLALPSDYFIHVQLTCGGSDREWLPAAFVLQGSGLAPAPQSIRASKAVEALESFLNIVGDWDFFGQGLLRIKEVSSLAIGTTLPVWQKVGSKITNDVVGTDSSSLNASIPKGILSARDFHTPKQTTGSASLPMILESPEKHEEGPSSSLKTIGNTTKCITGDVTVDSTNMLKPLSNVPSKRKTRPGNKVSAVTKPVNGSNCFGGKHSSEDHNKGQNRHKPLESILVQRDENILQPSSEALRKAKKAGDAKGDNCPENTENIQQGKIYRKRTLDNNDENKENMPEGSRRMRSKKSPDQSDISDKVLNYHKRGELRSLTVVDLKRFLASKKEKVGGKKDELIQRITQLLS